VPAVAVADEVDNLRSINLLPEKISPELFLRPFS
jgi:hypothetical protein